MKKFYIMSSSLDGSISHFLISVGISFLVMGFVNTFMGGVGGVAVFFGFFLAFYLLRTLAVNGKFLSNQLAINSRTKVKYLLRSYVILFFLIWTVIKILMLISKVSGWGNVNKLGLMEYLGQAYGTTFLEKWAYIFTWILMISYIFSLFPLIIIKKWNKWICYLILDSIFFMIVCTIISKTAKNMVDVQLRDRISSVLDVMLLCNLPRGWEALGCNLIIVIFAINVALLAFNYSVCMYGPKPGRILTEDKLPAEFVKTKVKYTDIKKRIYRIILITGVVIIGFFVTGKYCADKNNEKLQYSIVAEAMTDDFVLGPIECNDAVYVPVSDNLNYDEEGCPLGYISQKGQKDNSLLKFSMNNIIYSNGDDLSYLQMAGTEYNSFRNVKELECKRYWMDDEVFILWDEDWADECAYSKNVTGYTECGKNLITGLENTFGEVDYDIEDFKDYDAYFTIRSYKDFKEVIEQETPYGDWVGCILVKDNEFYYGSYDNKITGVMLHQLLNVIGGN